MKIVSRLFLLATFCFGIAACATQPPAENYAVGNPPKPKYDAKTELEQGQYQKKK